MHQCLGYSGFAPAHGICAFPVSLLRLHVDLQVNCLKFALGCVHFPGLSHSGSGSWVLHENTDSVGPIICAFPRSEQLRGPGAWRVHSAQVGGASYHLPSPSPLASWVRCQSLTSGVPCVSSGKLISGCDLPGGCHPPRIQEDLVSNWETAHSLVEKAVSGAKIAPCLPALAGACLPLCLWWGNELV